MFRPSSLLRDNEDTQPRIEANASNIAQDSIDCGVTACGCCNGPGCLRLGTSTVFVAALSIVTFVSGGIESYFRLAAHQAGAELDFDPIVLDWLLVTAGIAQGVFALLVSYWGNRMHRITWLGGVFMLQAITLIVLIIPTLTHNSDESSTIEAINLDKMCTLERSGQLLADRPYAITTLVLMFIAQVLIGVANVVIYALGLSYVDDNVLEHHSPSLIGCVIGARIWGSQLGLAVGLAVGATSLGWWLGWTIIAPVTFLAGFAISLFPKRLLATMVRQAADDIIETATNGSTQSIETVPGKWLADIGFLATVKRLFSNKILLCNVLALVLVKTAIVNYAAHEQSYLQSRFFLPTSQADGINDEWTSRLITNLLKPPVAALSVIVAALIIAKANPSARKLAGWNIFVGVVAVGLFIAFIFISCGEEQIAGSYRGRKLIKPFCASNCLCAENVPFTPVCPVDSRFTYFSPCHAGCQSREEINNIVLYRNCTCGVDVDIVLSEGGDATEGACGVDDCQRYWIVFQVLTVIVTMLLATGLTGKVIISLRSVLRQDKAMALAVELTLVGLVVYLPGTAIYQVVATHTCQFWSADERQCFLHETPTFGNILNMITAALIIVGLIFEMVVFYFVKDMTLYGDEPDDSYRPVEMRFMPPARSPTQTELVPLNGRMQDTTDHTASDSVRSDSDTIVPSVVPTVDPLNGSVQTIQNTQPGYQARSVSPLATFGGVNYAQVVKQLPRRENSSDIDEQLDFRSATSLPRADSGDSSDDTDHRPNVNTVRDYTRGAGTSGAPGGPSGTAGTRTQNFGGRPMSPETDF
ncbi:solute carrier organic anion transporter family member 1C1 [Anopheles bellator]|uniref:solute carrier organic anion transporter family member 1C1 n=1 Tax=Anopheles bellator TaxID=139047 RepID=UPI0026494AF6|nr:solute carrier organic anion transporter family member 1C1 [Anopheles bellator]